MENKMKKNSSSIEEANHQSARDRHKPAMGNTGASNREGFQGKVSSDRKSSPVLDKNSSHYIKHPLMNSSVDGADRCSEHNFESFGFTKRNMNRNFNAQDDEECVRYNTFSNSYDRRKCNYDENPGGEDRLAVNFQGTKHFDCCQVSNKMKRFNKIFYNGISNNVERCTPEYQTHAAELLKFLSSLWMSRSMCDLALKIENRKYLAHRLGLAMFSRKYREEFKTPKKTEDGVIAIKLENTTDVALEAILKYIYTAEIDINPANADEILSGAKELGIDNIICMTQDYLNSLSIGDLLIYMVNIFGKDGADLVVYQIYVYIMKNLLKISRTPEYVRSSICTVKAILCDSNLQVESETEVFDAAIKWVAYDRTKREYDLVEMMTCIRFTQMSPHEMMSRIEAYPCLQNSKELSIMLLNAFKYHSFKCYNEPVMTNLVKPEEKRNQNLNGTSVPEFFVHALKELANIAIDLKRERDKAIENVARFLDIEYQPKCCFKVTPAAEMCIKSKNETCPCCVQVKSNCYRQADDDLKSCSSNSLNVVKKCCEKPELYVRSSGADVDDSRKELKKLCDEYKMKTYRETHSGNHCFAVNSNNCNNNNCNNKSTASNDCVKSKKNSKSNKECENRRLYET